MIYSQNINKICAVCRNARANGDNDEMYCSVKKQAVPINGAVCAKFGYDILKRHVRRSRKIKTDFKPEDFTL